MTKTIGTLTSNSSSNTTPSIPVTTSPAVELTSFISVINPISTTFKYTITSDVTNDFTVDWGDGTAIETFGNVAEITHEYPSAGVEYTVIIDGDIAGITPNTKNDLIKVLRCAKSFKTLADMCNNCSNLTEFNTTGLGNNIASVASAWYRCISLTSFDTSGLKNYTNTIDYAWFRCSALTSFDTTGMNRISSSAEGAWQFCTGLTSFNASGLSSLSSCFYTWAGCTSLTSFNTIGLENVLSCSYAWSGCTALVKFYTSGLISATNVNYAWSGCSALNQFSPRQGCLAFLTNYDSPLSGTIFSALSLSFPQ